MKRSVRFKIQQLLQNRQIIQPGFPDRNEQTNEDRQNRQRGKLQIRQRQTQSQERSLPKQTELQIFPCWIRFLSFLWLVRDRTVQPPSKDGYGLEIAIKFQYVECYRLFRSEFRYFDRNRIRIFRYWIEDQLFRNRNTIFYSYRLFLFL